MSKQSKKKTSRERRVLIGALGVAAVMIGGSTFAWFTSKDEVTNRLSASASYNVAIAEDFTPPEDWVPGQTIKKEAGAVNTGNVDAFVRMWLTGDMKLVKEDAGVVYTTFATTTLTAVTDQSYLNLSLEKTDTNKNYYRVLTADERKALQTGELAYAGGTYKIGTETSAAFTDGQGLTVKNISSADFTPTASGLYIFRREYDLDANTGNVNPDTANFSGYYFDGSKYYALKTANDSTVPGGVASKGGNVYISELYGKSGTDFDTALATVKVYTAKENTLKNSDLTWTYTVPNNSADSPFNSTNPYFSVSQTSGSDTFKINIELDNIGDGNAPDQWQPISTADKTTFYYTNDVEAGGQTEILVKSVQLDKGATQKDFLAFDFDLNVNLESIQVTKDDAGKEKTTPVNAWAATEEGNPAAAINTGAKPSEGDDAKTYESSEISVIGWEANLN